MSCPACKGPKSKRALLCATCRRRANAVGANVWIQTAVPEVPAMPRTGQQSRIYYGKCAALARLESPSGSKAELDKQMRAIKKRMLEWASQRFRRQISSSTELTEIEMDIVSERLDDLLGQHD